MLFIRYSVLLHLTTGLKVAAPLSASPHFPGPQHLAPAINSVSTSSASSFLKKILHIIDTK